MRWRPDRALLTAAAVVAFEQWTKWLAFSQLTPGESESVFPGVSLGQTRNEGIAFGFFAGQPWLVFSLMAVALAVLIWFYLRHRGRPGLWLATGLLLGGAIGNAIDRISAGYVRDFIELPRFPSFNLADVAITFGVILLVLTVEQNPREDEESDASPVED
ncbi:MAG: signal peptidase II [Solirubrobacterales bacterium]|nr:signal peptidase II [Solirubrobacterales bacterium]